jgi:hypothetical protein
VICTHSSSVSVVGILMMNDRVMANKWISRHHLLMDSSIKGNLRGLLERGVQESMDWEETFDEMLEVAVSYAGSMGTSLWSEIKDDRAQVSPGYSVVVVDWLTKGFRWIGWMWRCPS